METEKGAQQSSLNQEMLQTFREAISQEWYLSGSEEGLASGGGGGAGCLRSGETLRARLGLVRSWSDESG